MKDIFNLKMAVFTSKHVIESGSPITYVSHDINGDWQFHSEEDLAESDARMVGLGEIIELDESIKELLEMPVGYYAIRTNKSENWKIEKPNN